MVHAVPDQRAHIMIAKEGHRRGPEAWPRYWRRGLPVITGLVLPYLPARVHDDRVSRDQIDPGCLQRVLQFVTGDRLGGIGERHCAQGWDIQQHRPSGDAVFPLLDAAPPRTLAGDLARRIAIPPEAVLGPDMAKCVDVREVVAVALEGNAVIGHTAVGRAVWPGPDHEAD